ncbi:MAG: hypothetical protein RLZZ126_493 [Pseudomonadota bacterium]|jgi:hypothetical protein
MVDTSIGDMAAPVPERGFSQEQIYIHLIARAQQATSLPELVFSIVNESIQLVTYQQAAYFSVGSSGRLSLSCASGLASVAETSPYTVWVNGFASAFNAGLPHQLMDFDDAAPDWREGWQEWLPDHLLLIPINDFAGQPLGVAMFAREQPWSEVEVSQLTHLHRTYAYCMRALTHQHRGTRTLSSLLSQSKTWLIAAAVLVACMLIPVRLSALAEAEIIALDSFAVSAPQDGVIRAFAVQPNTFVKKGDVLFTLDDTSVLNRHEVAAKALATARADALVAEQRAFDDMRAKATLAASLGRVKEKEAELQSVKTLMARVEIRAERDGLAVFVDPNDWIGRPVQTGERVMQLADPKDAGLLIWLPVRDAINIEPGASVRLFLHTNPLDPVSAQVHQTSYQASTSPGGIASYRLKATFAPGTELPRIGLHGTARISGEWSSLGYYLFRRPIAAAREYFGF